MMGNVLLGNETPRVFIVGAGYVLQVAGMANICFIQHKHLDNGSEPKKQVATR